MPLRVSFTTNVYLFQISVIGIPIQNTPPPCPLKIPEVWIYNKLSGKIM